MAATQPVDKEALRRTTAPRLLCERARTTPDSVAFRSKHLGLYRERSWRDYAAMVARAARAFADARACGRRPRRHHGRRLRGVDDLRPRRAVARRHRLRHLSHRLRLRGRVSDARRRRRGLHRREPGIRRQDPAVRRAPARVALDRRDRRLGDVRLRASASSARYRDVARRGRAARSRLARAAGGAASSAEHPPSSSTPPARPATRRARWSPTASISPRPRTSSTTIRRSPRRSIARSSILPLCHVLGRDVAVTLAADLAPRAAFRRGPGRSRDRRCSRPRRPCCSPCRATCRNSPRRCWSDCSTRPASSARPTDLAMRFARAHARRRWDGATTQRTRRSIGSAGRPCSRRSSTSSASTGSSWSSAPARRCRPRPWRSGRCWGVNVVEMYGQTETAGGIISGQRGPFPRPGDVGTVPAGWQVKLADDGEVLVQSPDLFESLLEQRGARPAPSRARTAGCAPATSANGATVRCASSTAPATSSSPRAARRSRPRSSRTSCVRSPYVAEAIVFGHGRNYLTALIEIDADTVADWARSHDVPYTGFTSLASSPDVRAPDQGGDRPGQRRARARRADQGLPHSAQGARSGGGGRAGHARPARSSAS